jgi:hypothetical protein
VANCNTDQTIVRDVLVVGTDDWTVERAVDQLKAAGQRTHRCSDSVESPFPCNALVPGRGCPLDRGPVHVVLAVRGHPRSAVSLGEMGAICGLRAGLPLVTAGLHGSSGLTPWSTPVASTGDIVSACAHAVLPPTEMAR